MAQLEGSKLEGPKGEEEFLNRCAVKFVSTIFQDAVNDMGVGTVIEPEKEVDDEYEEVWDLASEDDVEDVVAQAMALVHGDLAPSAGETEAPQLMQQEEDAIDMEDYGQEEVYEAEDFVLDYICGLLDDEINDAAVVAELVRAPACRRLKSDHAHVEEMAPPFPSAGSAPMCASVFSVPELLHQQGPARPAGGAAWPPTPQTSMEALVGCSGPAGTHTAGKPAAQDPPLPATTASPEKSAAPAAGPSPAKGSPDRNAGPTKTATLVTSASSPALRQPARSLHASRSRRRVIGGVVRVPAASEEVSCPPSAKKDAGARADKPHRRAAQEKALDAMFLRKPSTPPWAPPFSSDLHGSLAKLSKVSSAMSLDLNGDLPSKPCSHLGLSKDFAPQRQMGVPPTFARSLSVGTIHSTTKEMAENLSTLPRFKVSDSVLLPAIGGGAQGAAGSIAWNRHKAKSTRKGLDFNQDLRLGKQHDAPMSLPWAVL